MLQIEANNDQIINQILKCIVYCSGKKCGLTTTVFDKWQTLRIINNKFIPLNQLPRFHCQKTNPQAEKQKKQKACYNIMVSYAKNTNNNKI